MELQKFESVYDFNVIVFDLDNTLYNENEFLFSAYKTISKYLAEKNSTDPRIYEIFLIETFKKDGRLFLFNKLLDEFHLNKIVSIDEILHIMHHHQVPLKFNPKAFMLLKSLVKKNKSIFILTNGSPIQQKNKVIGLKITEKLPQINILYANEYKPKPSPFCIHKIIDDYKFKNSEILLIGDSEVDKQTASNSGIAFLNILKFTENGIK